MKDSYLKFKYAVVLIILLLAITDCGSGNGSEDRAPKRNVPTTLEGFNDSSVTVGVVSGYIFEDVAKRTIPNVNIKVYDSIEMVYKALQSGAVDGVIDDDGAIRARMRSMDTVDIVEGYLEPSDYGYIFPKNDKGEALAEEFNLYLEGVRASGELSELDAKWFGSETDNKKSEDISEMVGDETLRVCFETEIPFAYMSARRPTGYEVDLLIGFCKEKGYGLELSEVDFEEQLRGVAAGEFDIGISAISITDERRETLLFSDPVYSGGIGICVSKRPENAGVKDAGGMAGAGDSKTGSAEGLSGGGNGSSRSGKSPGMMKQIENHFQKAFIEKDRYMLFLKGIIVTVIMIMIVTAVGTPFGIILYMAKKRGNPFVKALAGILSWLVYVVPPVMIIMLIYFIYYNSLKVGGYIAAYTGFILSFGADICRIIERRAGKPDMKAIEDDYRLEGINTKEFFKKLLEIGGDDLREAHCDKVVTLIKMTAVVGYVAVQDMTKVVDIIRTDSLIVILPLVAMSIVYALMIITVRASFGIHRGGNRRGAWHREKTVK